MDKLELEVEIYHSMRRTEWDIDNIQSRIYCFPSIPLEVRDELSKKLYDVRVELADYSKKLGKSLLDRGAFN